jgi:hypothetical protein
MTCAVYILTNDRRTVLYVGVTSELEQRVAKHKLGWSPGEEGHADRGREPPVARPGGRVDDVMGLAARRDPSLRSG